MTKEEKHALFLKYVKVTGVKLEAWGRELGYEQSTMSNFNRGHNEVPLYVAWGISQALSLLALQKLIGK